MTADGAFVMIRSVIAVFGKVPEPGVVKTRLAAVVGNEWAAVLYHAFLLDAIDQYKRLEVDVRVYLAPAKTGLPDLPADSVFRQTGPDLGSRIHNAVDHCLSDGFGRVVVVGTDHPGLPTHYLQRALDVLSEPGTACLGPAEDGGYYLIGLNAPAPHVFLGMQYSHAEVFVETVARVRSSRLKLATLPSWYDVDEFADLLRLREDIRSGRAAGDLTKEAIAQLFRRRPDLLPADSVAT